MPSHDNCTVNFLQCYCSSASFNCGPSGIWSTRNIPSKFVVKKLAWVRSKISYVPSWPILETRKNEFASNRIRNLKYLNSKFLHYPQPLSSMYMQPIDSHLTCKVANKCLNVRERPWKKTLKKKKKKLSHKKDMTFTWIYFNIIIIIKPSTLVAMNDRMFL